MDEPFSSDHTNCFWTKQKYIIGVSLINWLPSKHIKPRKRFICLHLSILSDRYVSHVFIIGMWLTVIFKIPQGIHISVSLSPLKTSCQQVGKNWLLNANRAFLRFGDSHISVLRPQNLECNLGLSWFTVNIGNLSTTSTHNGALGAKVLCSLAQLY